MEEEEKAAKRKEGNETGPKKPPKSPTAHDPRKASQTDRGGNAFGWISIPMCANVIVLAPRLAYDARERETNGIPLRLETSSLSAPSTAELEGAVPYSALAVSSNEDPMHWRRAMLTVMGPSGSDPPAKVPLSTPGEPGEGEDLDLEDAPVSQTPRRYKVIFHNDDYTTQEFVIYVLQRFFHKAETEARHIMLTVHVKGAAVAGVFTKDVAETKAQQVMDAARENGMPLLLTTEPE